MVKRFRQDADTAANIKRHLTAIDELMAIDTPGYKSDPYNLLQNGVLLVRDAEEDEDDQEEGQPKEQQVDVNLPISVTDFLKSALEPRHHCVIISLRTPFSSRLMSEKMSELDSYGQKPTSRMHMHRPQLAYFKSDLPLMKRVLKEMEDNIKIYIEQVYAKAKQTVQDLADYVHPDHR